jgi:hypothetical protein
VLDVNPRRANDEGARHRLGGSASGRLRI